MNAAPVHVLSLGAGVQSSAMALMAAAGELTPMPSFAVFADTGDEPSEVYQWLQELSALLPFRVKIAHKPFDLMIPIEERRLSANLVEYEFSQIPAFVRGEAGKPVIGKRQCTKHWKVLPVMRKIREALNKTGLRMDANSVVLWQGISWDEITRMKPSRETWLEHRFPLIENRLTREHCISWMLARGYRVPPKSACVFCPYKDRLRWQADKLKGGEDWETVRKVDRILEQRDEFLTADLKRIDYIDFTKPAPQPEDPLQMNLFGNECEGMCGV